MEEINAFVDRQNVTRFRNQLGKGVENGPARNLLLDLLVEHEKRLGIGQEQLERVDRHIARLRQIIASQMQLIGQLRAKRLSTDRAEVVLATLNDMMFAHLSLRQTIVATTSINDELIAVHSLRFRSRAVARAAWRYSPRSAAPHPC